MDPATGTPEDFAKIVAADYAKWGPIVTASGFKPE
jgi:tripartite-type tricarboxylate transporter receptor subunit TctC